MSTILKKILDFIVKSSADPTKTSLALKGVLLAAVTWFAGQGLQLLGLVCQFSSQCVYLDPSLIDQLKMLVDAVVEIVYQGLLLIAAIIAGYGYFRKFLRTVRGENLAIK